MTGKELAALAERYLAGELKYREFLDQAPDKPRNPDAWGLVDLIEHEPQLRDKKGNLTKVGSAHLAQVRNLIERLKEVQDELFA